MRKYSNKLILDYINGNEIHEYNIEELENDIEFMKKVIDCTNDKNMYNLCSEELKNNYEFVKFIIIKFKNDIDFICKIADKYLDKVNEGIERTELVIIMRNLTENKNKEQFDKYNLFAEATYSLKKVQLEIIKAQQPDDIKDEIQMGFWFVIDDLGSSEEIVNYYAKQFIKDIIKEDEINLEILLHQRYSSSEELKKNGINNYLISFINLYDNYLSVYASSHLDILEEIKKSISKIINNWNHFDVNNEYKIYNKIFVSLHEYMVEHEDDCSFEETEILYYVGKELGISKKIAKHDGVSEEFYYDILENLLIDKSDMNFTELIHYRNIKQIMINALNINNNNDKNEENNNNNIKKCKILKINFDKNNSQK